MGRHTWVMRQQTGGPITNLAGRPRPAAVGQSVDFVADKAPFIPEGPPSEA